MRIHNYSDFGKPPAVSSNNEWDELKEVIVGNGFSEELPHIDLSFDLFFHDNIYNKQRQGYEYGTKLINKRYVAEMNEDVEGFVDLLKSHNIKVYRPDVPDKIVDTKTPYWKSSNHNALNVRDLSMIVGDTIIESSPLCRYRFFETDLLKPIFYEKFKQGAHWISSPRPMMKDENFDLDYTSKDTFLLNPTNDNCEIMWDAAQCIRLGNTILFNCSTVNHELGAQWLQRQLGKDYNVHIMRVCDNHIDSTIVPLRQGLFLLDASRADKVLEQLPEHLKKWDYLIAPESQTQDKYSKKDLKLASRSIDINVLSISEDQLICHDEYYPLLQPLVKPHGIECIPTRMRHSELFSGAFHCLTLDLVRQPPPCRFG